MIKNCDGQDRLSAYAIEMHELLYECLAFFSFEYPQGDKRRLEVMEADRTELKGGITKFLLKVGVAPLLPEPDKTIVNWPAITDVMYQLEMQEWQGRKKARAEKERKHHE